MRCRNERCHYNADCYCSQPDYVCIDENGECEQMVVPAVLNEHVDADSAPAVHGQWEDVQETEMYVPDMKFTLTKTSETCSVCRARIGFVGAKLYLFDAICPSCGAKMDGLYGITPASIEK